MRNSLCETHECSSADAGAAKEPIGVSSDRASRARLGAAKPLTVTESGTSRAQGDWPTGGVRDRRITIGSQREGEGFAAIAI